MKRINLALPQRHADRLDWLKQAIDASSVTEVLKACAFRFEILVQGLQAGRVLCWKEGNKIYPCDLHLDVEGLKRSSATEDVVDIGAMRELLRQIARQKTWAEDPDAKRITGIGSNPEWDEARVEIAEEWILEARKLTGTGPEDGE